MVKDVLAALRTIVLRAQANPEEARAAGLLPEDVEALVAAEPR